MNTDRVTVERAAEVLDDTDECEQYEPESNIARCITAPPQSMDWWCLPCIRKYTAAMLRALLNERDEERAEAEQWRVRCAGCLTAAEGHTSDPANDGDYGWTLAYQRTLELRQAYDALLQERDEARELAKRWRDLYEFDCIDPLPEYYFPWEAKPQILPPT